MQEQYETHTLPNGLRIISMRNMSEVAYCGYAIKAGSRDEMPGEDGLAHFCEHMTFKGTSRLSSLKVINTLELVGGELNAFTSKEETVYYSAVLRQHFHKAVDLLTEIVFHSTYPSPEMEKEKDVVCDEIDSYRDSPAELIYDDFENEIFHDTPLGHNVLGNGDIVRRFTSADCLRFTERLYRPANAVFYVVGNVSFPKLVKRLEQLFSSYDERLSTALSVRQPVTLPLMAVHRKDSDDMQTHQSHVMLGTAFTDDLDKWRTPLFLVNNLLGGPSMNSRLNLALRERRGLVYTVESVMTSYTDAMSWTTYFGCDHDDVARCLRLIRNQLNKLRSAPLSPSALMAAKRQIKGQIALVSENRENYAIDMAKQFLHRNTLKDNGRLFQRIDAVSSADIHLLANTILNEDRLFTLCYGSRGQTP